MFVWSFNVTFVEENNKYNNFFFFLAKRMFYLFTENLIPQQIFQCLLEIGFSGKFLSLNHALAVRIEPRRRQNIQKTKKIMNISTNQKIAMNTTTHK